MRRSPRRPLILKRRKLPFHQSQESEPQRNQSQPREPRCFPDGIRILDHPTMSHTQLVVIPKSADLQSVIGALTARGKECGVHGPNKFILLSGNDGRECSPDCPPPPSDGNHDSAETIQSSPDVKPAKMIKRSIGDDSITSMQWTDKMSQSESSENTKENQEPKSHASQAPGFHANKAPAPPQAERPPYSYMAMIQFAINSSASRRMTLKDIYMWIEDHFLYYRDVAKPGWKNSIRHNLSLHHMFIREMASDSKLSYWSIRPEVNRCLTLDQVYKAECDPVTALDPVPTLAFPHKQQQRMKTPTVCERRMKPLLPRTDAYLVPVQIPVASQLYLQPVVSSSRLKPKRSASRSAKRVRIAPKGSRVDPPVMAPSSQTLKVEPVCVPVSCETPKATPKRPPRSSSRRKQHLARSLHEEPVLLCPDTFLDSGVSSDASTFHHDARDVEPGTHHRQDSPDRDFSFKTPIKSTGHLTSSTPSKPPCGAPFEHWGVTPVGKGIQTLLDFSPLCTPQLDFSSTPFKDPLLFNSPRELLTPAEGGQRSCSRELLQPGGAATPTGRPVTEGLVLDTMNDSLSKILVDLSFTGLEDEDLGMANISWSEFFPQLK
ncbi:forkhead box protein M1 isoform X2 [Gouania willdenowi]|uniref:forkhead box protein M1 isoform X2 n=1 Tax=Gouania willdenowi TaxID=441366 RepID=UPI001055770C|nr:forkhead box protein M1 isoform X2 [Gouania willdenowi]